MNTAVSFGLGMFALLIVGIGVAEPLWAAPPLSGGSAKEDKEEVRHPPKKPGESQTPTKGSQTPTNDTRSQKRHLVTDSDTRSHTQGSQTPRHPVTDTDTRSHLPTEDTWSPTGQTPTKDTRSQTPTFRTNLVGV